MADDRRWSTAEVIGYGVLNLPDPETKYPEDFDYTPIYEDDYDDEGILAGLNKGGISGSMYYGCWYIWRNETGSFNGELLQYRHVTESFADVTIEEALRSANEWIGICRG